MQESCVLSTDRSTGFWEEGKGYAVTRAFLSQGITHSWFKGDVNFPFGYGLSYTSFAFAWDDAAAAATALTRSVSAHAASPLTLSVRVANAGAFAGDAVVLAFVNASVAGWPRQKLVRFERVHLRPREAKRVEFVVGARELSTVGDDGQRSLQPGRYTLRIGDVEAPAVRDVLLTGPAVAMAQYV